MSDLFAVFGVNWKLLLVQALNFGALLAVLSYLLYKPILRIIDERQAKVAEGVRVAEEAVKKLEGAKGESAQIVGHAAREAEKLLANARESAQVKGSELLKTAEIRAESILKDATGRAEEAQRQALQESQKEIARAAMLAAEKILREKSA